MPPARRDRQPVQRARAPRPGRPTAARSTRSALGHARARLRAHAVTGRATAAAVQRRHRPLPDVVRRRRRLPRRGGRRARPGCRYYAALSREARASGMRARRAQPRRRAGARVLRHRRHRRDVRGIVGEYAAACGRRRSGCASLPRAGRRTSSTAPRASRRCGRSTTSPAGFFYATTGSLPNPWSSLPPYLARPRGAARDLSLSASEAGRAARVEREALAHRHEPAAPRIGTERGGLELVLDVEHRLARAHERRQQRRTRRTAKHCSLSAQSKSRLELGDLGEVVLEPDGQAARVGRARQEAVERELIGRRQREAGVVGVAVDVVGLDAVEALLRGTGPGARSMIGPSTSSRRMSSQRSSGQPSSARPSTAAGKPPASGRPGSNDPALR